MKRSQPIKDVLDATFERISKIDPMEIELRADFSRYLCVLVSGYLEQAIRNAIAEYATRRATPTVANYVAKVSGRLTNLKSNTLRDCLLAFDPSWEGALEALLTGEAKDAVDSVVSLRHGIAHGQPADVTFERIARYYKEVVRVVAEIEGLMGVK